MTSVKYVIHKPLLFLSVSQGIKSSFRFELRPSIKEGIKVPFTSTQSNFV